MRLWRVSIPTEEFTEDTDDHNNHGDHDEHYDMNKLARE